MVVGRATIDRGEIGEVSTKNEPHSTRALANISFQVTSTWLLVSVSPGEVGAAKHEYVGSYFQYFLDVKDA